MTKWDITAEVATVLGYLGLFCLGISALYVSLHPAPECKPTVLQCYIDQGVKVCEEAPHADEVP